MKVLLIDDHALLRDGLRGILGELKSEAVFFEAADSARAMQVLAEHPDVGLVLLDLHLPDRDGLSTLIEIREQYPSAAVIVLSSIQERSYVLAALERGASGYVPKSTRREIMLRAFEIVFEGGIYVPPEILSPPSSESSLPTQGGLSASSPFQDITERQRDVLALMMSGKNNKEICRKLDLAPATVKAHVTAIFKTLGVNNRIQAVLVAKQRGWSSG